MDTMNIYANEGDKIIFKYPNNGYDDDIQTASEYLTLGQEYTVDYTDVGGSITYIKLKEIDGAMFNSVQFIDKEDE